MSGIVAIFNLDCRPVDRQQLEPMLDAMTHRGPDGIGRFCRVQAALGHAMLRVTPESFEEVQPLCDETGAMYISFDGRIDNRRELRELIEAAGAQVRSDTDPELVLKAYQSMGEDCVRKLLGDFAFVIWDSKQRRMFCARDHSGIRPFYYYCDGKTFLAASELQQILRHPGVPQEPNEGVVGEYLTGKLITRKETLYRGVMRLEPAHMMIVADRSPRISRYYNLDPSRSIRYRTDQEYSAHFLEIFKGAVRCRMRACNGVVGAELSGGLDSSSIVCTAQSMIRRGEIPVPRFEAFSLIYNEPASDERAFAEAVADKSGVMVNWVQPYEIDLQASLDGVRRSRDFAEHPNGPQFRNLRQAVVEHGIRVLLTGLGGDQFLSGSEYYFAELLSRFQFADLIRTLKSDGRLTSLDSAGESLKMLFWWGMRPLLPDNLRHRLSDVVPRERFPTFIPDDFARRIDLIGRLRAGTSRPPGISFSQLSMYERFVDGWMAHVMEREDTATALAGIEEWHPYYDLRLIEFCFAIPDEQRMRNGCAKYLLRNAMNGLLPDAVRERTTKSELSQTLVRLFDRVGGANFFNDLTIAEKGWVNAPIARKAAHDMLSDPNSNLWPLMNTFSIEVWYNAVFHDGGDLLTRSARSARASA